MYLISIVQDNNSAQCIVHSVCVHQTTKNERTQERLRLPVTPVIGSVSRLVVAVVSVIAISFAVVPVTWRAASVALIWTTSVTIPIVVITWPRPASVWGAAICGVLVEATSSAWWHGALHERGWLLVVVLRSAWQLVQTTVCIILVFKRMRRWRREELSAKIRHVTLTVRPWLVMMRRLVVLIKGSRVEQRADGWRRTRCLLELEIYKRTLNAFFCKCYTFWGLNLPGRE